MSLFDRTMGEISSLVYADSRSASSAGAPEKDFSSFINLTTVAVISSRSISGVSTLSVIKSQILLLRSKFNSIILSSISLPVQVSFALVPSLFSFSRTKVESAAPVIPVVPDTLFIGSSSFCFLK